MEPATAALIARAAIAAGTNKKVWTGIASVLAALCLPVILAVMCYISIASGGTEHNRAARLLYRALFPQCGVLWNPGTSFRRVPFCVLTTSLF